MSPQRKSKISHLNDASEKIVQSYEYLEEEVEKLSKDYQYMKEIKVKLLLCLKHVPINNRFQKKCMWNRIRKWEKKISEYFLLQMGEYSNAQFAKKNV